MKKGLLAVLLLVLAGLLWWGDRQARQPAPSVTQDAPPRAYDFEAQDAVLRQMDAEGQLQFEVEAERIVQLPEGGGLLASDLTLYHDPEGTPAASPQRWTLKAREGRLPSDGRIVYLNGDVQGEGLPMGFRNPLRLTTEALDFDMDRQLISIDGEADFSSGGYSFSGTGLTVDGRASLVQLQSAKGKIALAATAGATGHLVVEDSRNLQYTREGVLTADDVLITHGRDTRMTSSQARHTQRSGSNSELNLASQVHIEFRGALLDADSALLKFRGQNLLTVGVKGTPARFSHQPEGYTRRVNGRANTIDYDAASSDVTFSGNPSFTNSRGSDLSSDIVVYNVDSGVVRLESAHGKIPLDHGRCRTAIALGVLALAGAGTFHAVAAELTGFLVIEKSRKARYTPDGVYTAEDVVLTHGEDTRIAAEHARLTPRSGGTSELDLTGGVHIEFRGALLDADSAAMKFRGPELLSVSVKGSQANFSHQPEGYTRRIDGRADAIGFDAATSEVTFSGNTAYTDGRNSLASDLIIYNIEDGAVRDDGDRKTRGRATIRLGNPADRVPPPRQPDRSTAQ